MPAVKLSPLFIGAAVGVGAPNRAHDVTAVQQRLQYIRDQSTRNRIPLRRPDYAGLGSRGEISRMPSGVCDDITIGWIKEFQSIFLRTPDGVISPGGTTNKFLSTWGIRPVASDVTWMGRLETAWLLLSPLLPDGSKCESAYRTADDQRRIIDRMFQSRYADELKRKLGARYDTILASTGDARYGSMVTELRAVGQSVAMPGRSPHQRGKAIDIGGPSTIDAEQVRIARMVGNANGTLFSGHILKERNGCVHVEIN
jgi:hypothetical protein